MDSLDVSHPPRGARRWRALWISIAAAVPGLGLTAPPLSVEAVAPGVYVHRGVHEEISAANGGAIANIGFVVGGRCVAVIDTGGSPAVGRALRRAVRAVTERPICYVINTHVHPDHILGNLAFEGDDPDYVGHHRLPEAIAARGEYYRTSVARALGRELPDGVLVAPDRVVEDERVLDLGGRELRLQALPPAHTDNDLLVEDSATGTLWASDLVFVDRAPSLDGSLKGWLAVLDRLMGMPAARAVPGHGPPSVSWPAGAEPLHGYLETLLRRTRRALEEGATMEEAVERVGRVGRGDWRLLEHTHRRNVMAAYAELEWE